MAVVRADVVVIGGGAMGAAAAWWLARRRGHVVLLEQFGPRHHRGSSHGGSRIFRLAYPDPRFVAMAVEALPLWRELEADAGVALLNTTGAIDHGHADDVQAIADALRGADIEHELLDAEAAAAWWPGMRFESPVVAHPAGGRALADATVAALHRRIADLGASLRFETAVRSIRTAPGDSGAVVSTDDTDFHASVVVVAAGAWAETLLAGLAPLPRLTVTQEQTFHFRPRGDTTAWPSFIHYRADRPAVYGLETPGEGVKVAEHHTGKTVDPNTRDGAIDVAGRDRVRQYVEQWLPGLDPDPVNEATCLYTSTPDFGFVVERQGPIVVVSACSGHGFKFVPLIGRMAADLC